MRKSNIEKSDRVFIPKEIRDKAGLHEGENVEVKIEDDGIVVRSVKSMGRIKELRGCVKESKIDPLELKKMWGM